MDRRQWIMSALATGVSLSTSACKFGGGQGPKAKPRRDELPEWTRCVSASVLQERLLSTCKDGECTDQAALTLGGLTRLDGFILVPGKKDLLLVGAVEDGLPPLPTSDLIVALRAATHRYRDAEGRPMSHPGVSIDPRPGTIKQLMEFGRDRADTDHYAAWAEICSQPQDLRIIGLPRESNHYLRTIAVVDEETKSYVDGTRELAGLEVPSRVVIERAKARAARGKAPEVRAEARMSRYWFNAGEVDCAVDDTQCLLTNCQVKLSTEAQMAREGALSDSGKRDELADRCSASFTTLLPTLAKQDPLYRELLNIYAVQSLATAMVQRDALRRAVLSWDPLLDRWQVPLLKMRLEIPGRAAMAQANIEQPRKGGAVVHQLRMPSCGGVNVNPSPRYHNRHDAAFVELAQCGVGTARGDGRLQWDTVLKSHRVDAVRYE